MVRSEYKYILCKHNYNGHCWEEQRLYEFPGLAREVTDICLELGVDDANTTMAGKAEYRKLLSEACINADTTELKAEMDKLKKCAKIKLEDCRLKPYLTRKVLRDVRDIFRERNFLLPFAGNYPNSKHFKSVTCPACDSSEREDQSHILICDGYTDIRKEYNMEDDDDLLQFYRRVLERRDEMFDNKT